MTGMQRLLGLLLLAALATPGLASCFGRDASWRVGGKPTVTQPSKNEPGKVMVAWSQILNNPQCVDKFTVWAWPDGTNRTGITAKRIPADKAVKSVIVKVEACVNYRFSVELEETELRSRPVFTAEQQLRTVGLPAAPRLLPAIFTVGYRWDPVKKVSDLRTASIKFPRASVTHPSCLDYIQVTGTEVRSVTRASPGTTASMTAAVQWRHLATSSGSPHLSVGHASTLPARVGGSPSVQTQCTSSLVGQRFTTAPLPRSLTVGKASTLPARLPAAASPFGPVEMPAYSGALPRRPGGATRMVGPVKERGPWLRDMIELQVPVPDCAEFNFEVSLYGAGKALTTVRGIHLPALADIPSYVPPPVTRVMTITFSKTGSPVYGVKTSSGVSAACLPAYFEAVDSYRQRLENEVGWHAGQNANSRPLPAVPRPAQQGGGAGQTDKGPRSGVDSLVWYTNSASRLVARIKMVVCWKFLYGLR